jgi:hypothetical protein
VVVYLGKADDLLARLRGAETLTIRSVSHGAVAAMAALARELDVAGTIDRQLQASGRRSRSRLPRGVRLAPLRNDGLSVGQSLVLASIGRACHATSKRGFASWAKTTSLGELFGVDPDRLTSQHFWDQMEQLPVDAIAPIERKIVGRVVERFAIPLETLVVSHAVSQSTSTFIPHLALEEREEGGLDCGTTTPSMPPPSPASAPSPPNTSRPHSPRSRRCPPKAQYVNRILDAYRALPGTLGRVLRQDRKAALAFYRRGVDLEVVHSAFVLALARRAFRAHGDDLEPIRCLSYFVPVVEELIQQPPLPEYLDYLRSKLVTAGLLQSA